APQVLASSLSFGCVELDRMKNGTVERDAWLRTQRSSSMPSISGILMSEQMMPGTSAVKKFRAASPSFARCKRNRESKVREKARENKKKSSSLSSTTSQMFFSSASYESQSTFCIFLKTAG